jgi:hypothetical protein
MGKDPDVADNRWLREAMENRVPIVYFLGIAPGRYQAMLPAFISGWDATTLKARVAFGVTDHNALAPPATALERRYALRTVKQRLHQASFREAVIAAYNGRCALSGLPESVLLPGTCRGPGRMPKCSLTLVDCTAFIRVHKGLEKTDFGASRCAWYCSHQVSDVIYVSRSETLARRQDVNELEHTTASGL